MDSAQRRRNTDFDDTPNDIAVESESFSKLVSAGGPSVETTDRTGGGLGDDVLLNVAEGYPQGWEKQRKIRNGHKAIWKSLVPMLIFIELGRHPKLNIMFLGRST